MAASRKGLVRAIMVVIALFIATHAHATPVVITNNSFESGTFVNDGNGTMVLPVGSTAISGWTVFFDQLAWIISPNPWGLAAQDGNRFLDLTAYPTGAPFGGIQQAFSTTVGDQYLVNYYLGSYTQRWGGPPVSIQTSAAGQSQTCTVTTTSTSSTWTLCTMTFVANSPSTTLSFLGTAGLQYIGLDNVTVDDLGPTGVTPVPEPTSMLLLGTGLAGVWMRRIQRARTSRRAGDVPTDRTRK